MPGARHPQRTHRAWQRLRLAGPGTRTERQGTHLAGPESRCHGVLASTRPRRRRRRPAGIAAPSRSAPLMKWVYLGIAIVAEILATSALKSAEGFTRLLPRSEEHTSELQS